MKTARRVMFWGIGLTLLAVLIYEVGIIAAWTQVRQMGWGYVPVLLIALGWHVSNTWAWAMCFDGGRPHFWSLFCTKLSGEAVGNVTPASHVGGEVAKAYMLRDRVSVTQGVPTLVINKTVELVSGLVFALIGTGLAVGMFPLSNRGADWIGGCSGSGYGWDCGSVCVSAPTGVCVVAGCFEEVASLFFGVEARKI